MAFQTERFFRNKYIIDGANTWTNVFSGNFIIIQTLICFLIVLLEILKYRLDNEHNQLNLVDP